jgi:hypothetical protein
MLRVLSYRVTLHIPAQLVLFMPGHQPKVAEKT